MKTIVVIVGAIFTLLATQANAIEQIKYNQTRSDQFGKDSTDIIPFDGLFLVPPTVNTSITNGTYPGFITHKGQCGASNNSYLPSSPDRFLCDSGVASAVSTLVGNGGNETYSWTCTGTQSSSADNTQYCSASKKVVASCGTANGNILTTQPSVSQMCAEGEASGYSQVGNQASWSCTGTPYTPVASCGATIKPPEPPAWESWIGKRVCLYQGADLCWMGNVTVDSNGFATGNQIGSGPIFMDIRNIFTIAIGLQDIGYPIAYMSALGQVISSVLDYGKSNYGFRVFSY